MTPELKQSIDSLKKISPELNRVTDRASQIVARVEKLLNQELSIGIPGVQFLKEEGIAPNGTREWYVVYKRVDGLFRIAIEEGLREDEDAELKTEETTLWAQAPRELKLVSVAGLPDLLAYITQEAERIMTKADAAADAIEKMVEALNGK
jgi:hypothetical protein